MDFFFFLKNIHFIRKTNYVPLSHLGFWEWFAEQTKMLYELGRMSAKPTGFSKWEGQYYIFELIQFKQIT